jgi:transposase
MIAIGAQTRIFVQTEPVHFRLGIDGLVAQCREVLGHDPFSGALFVFRNKKGTSLKILFYDSQGFWLAQKRFSEGKMKYWPQTEGTALTRQLAARELQTLLWNGNPDGAAFASEWRKISLAS